MKLSFRDKAILAFVVVLLTFLAGYFIAVKPQISDINASKKILSVKKDEKKEMQKKIASLDTIKNSEIDKKAQLVQLSGFFFLDMRPEDRDKYIYEIAAARDISIDTMSIAEPEVKELEIYKIKETKKADSVEKDDDQKNEKLVADCSKVTITFRAPNQDVIRAFLDDVDKIEKAITVTSCKMDNEEEANRYVTTIEISFYSVKSVDELLN